MSKIKLISFSLLTYWCLFWFLNALDKIFARQMFVGFRWWGNDRVEKFEMYFDRLLLDLSLVKPVLLSLGLVEIIVAVLFIQPIINSFLEKDVFRYSSIPIVASIGIFLAFAIFDVVVGDRAELLEHSTYVGVLIISYIAIAIEEKLPVIMGRDFSSVNSQRSI